MELRNITYFSAYCLRSHNAALYRSADVQRTLAEIQTCAKAALEQFQFSCAFTHFGNLMFGFISPFWGSLLAGVTSTIQGPRFLNFAQNSDLFLSQTLRGRDIRSRWSFDYLWRQGSRLRKFYGYSKNFFFKFACGAISSDSRRLC